MLSPARRLLVPASWLRLPHRTARVRLTLLYGGLFVAAGAGLLAVVYVLYERALSRLLVRVPRRLSGGPPLAQRPVPAAAMHALLIQSAIALSVMAVVALALGWLVAGRVLRPLREITATARRISATSLHERLALDGPDDEFKELADTLDGLLARLEAAFHAQRHFVASASHELRTPLTLDKVLLQVRLRDAGATVEQWRSTGRELLESGQQQERLLEALLTLATSEVGVTHRLPVDLAEVTTASLRSAAAEIERRHLHLQTTLSPAPLLGDPDLIEHLIANLLDNAAHYNVPDGVIVITTACQDGGAVLSVANSGPVIPAGEVDRLFQPFQRLEATRADNGDGHGLGLSIVRAIATAHGAALTAHAQPEGGLHINVRFLASDCPPPSQPRPAIPPDAH
jgi:signal transduction histidine kinase